MALTHLSDDELLSRTKATCEEGNRLLARLILLLIEVEERRLHERKACSSMFEFCRRRLGMCEATAYRRATAAALVRRFPVLLGAIERGELHLSALVLLRDHLTSENVDELVAAASRKSTREVEELLARRAPRPDAPAMLRKLPKALPLAVAEGEAAPVPPPSPQPRPPRIAPLSEERYAMQLTISRELRDKIERARDLMSHRSGSRDLVAVVDHAVDALLAQLEKQRLGKAKRPQKASRGTEPGTISQAARREVFERDGERCTFVDEETGDPCASTAFLELDHVVPRGVGGSDDAANLRVRCRAHNRLYAEQTYGRAHIEARIRSFRHRKLSVHDAAAEVARRGLVHLGFREREAQRALDVVAGRHANDRCAPLAAREILREALAVLTP